MRIDRVKLISAMAKKEVTGKELATRVGVSPTTISTIRSGRSCSDETGRAIADALKIPLESLIVKGDL